MSPTVSQILNLISRIICPLSFGKLRNLRAESRVLCVNASIYDSALQTTRIRSKRDFLKIFKNNIYRLHSVKGNMLLFTTSRSTHLVPIEYHANIGPHSLWIASDFFSIIPSTTIVGLKGPFYLIDDIFDKYLSA